MGMKRRRLTYLTVALSIMAALISTGCPEPEVTVTYSVTIEPGIENGSISASPQNAAAGETITLTIFHYQGYELYENSLIVKQTDGTGVPIDGSGRIRTFIMPASNVTVNAGFGRPTYYNVTVQTGILNGTIATDATITEINGITYSTAYYGDTITVTITPDEFYNMKEDSLTVMKQDVTMVDISGSYPTYTFTMPASNVVINGEFEASDLYAVNIPETIENGTITPNLFKAFTEETVTLIITPDEGYQLKENSLSVTQTDGTPVTINESDGTYTFSMPASNVTINGEFEKQLYSVTVEAGIQNGSISANPTSFFMDETVTLTITSDTGYILRENSLSVTQTDGTEVPISGSGTTRTFTMPASNVTVSGEFGRQYTVTIQSGITNGRIMADIGIAAEEDTITLTILPNAEYSLKESSLSVTQTNGTAVQISGRGRTRTFIMPASNVTVSGEFEKPEVPSNNDIYIRFEGFYDENIDLSRNHSNDMRIGSNQTLRLEVPQGYDSYFWYINGEPRSEENVFTLAMNEDIWDRNAVGYHTITVVVQKGNQFYSKNLTFRVVL